MAAMLLTDRDEMINLCRGPSIGASHQISVHLAKKLQRRSILEIAQSEKKLCLWRPYLLTDQSVMSKAYRGSSIDTSYQVSVHLTRRILEIDQSETRIACGGHFCHWIRTI